MADNLIVDTIPLGGPKNNPQFKGEVINYAALPPTGNAVGDVYYTTTGQGVWGINRKPSDYYTWTGSDWRGTYNKLQSVTGLGFTGVEQVLSATTGAEIESRLAALEHVVYGEILMTTSNTIVTPLTVGVPAKLLTGANDESNALTNVTKPADNRLQVNEASVANFKIFASLSLDKGGSGTQDYTTHIYMDGAPLPKAVFTTIEISGRDQNVTLEGTVVGVSTGIHYFELWCENIDNDNDVTWETGQFSVERTA